MTAVPVKPQAEDEEDTQTVVEHDTTNLMKH